MSGSDGAPAATTVATGRPDRSPSPAETRRTAASPATRPLTPASSPLVKVQRTGGIAGVQDVVEVRTTGTWTATRRGGAARSGRLTSARLSALKALVDNPAWQSEATRTSNRQCADAFIYSITTTKGSARTDDCAMESQPTLSKMVNAVISGAGI